MQKAPDCKVRGFAKKKGLPRPFFFVWMQIFVGMRNLLRRNVMLVHTKTYSLHFRSEVALRRFTTTLTNTLPLSRHWAWDTCQRIAWRDMVEPPSGPSGPASEECMIPADLWRELANGELWFWQGEEAGLPYQGYAWADNADELQEIVEGMGYWLVDCRRGV